MVPPTLANSSVLITGGAGFIGSHLAEALATETQVTVLDNFSNSTPANVPDTVTVLEADVTDRATLAAAVANADVIFHQAAQISVDKSIQAPFRSHEINVDATLTLLELAREHDVRVVIASSCAIYGRPDEVPISETASLDPISPYGLEKLTVDHYARLYHDLYDVDTVALRYFNVYGPRQAAGDYSGVISVFLNQARNDEPLTIHGEGTQTRDFVHVSDVVQANLLAATTPHVGEAFNIGTGTPTRIVDLAHVIADVTSTSSEIVHTEPRAGDIDHSCADITKAREYLGYEPDITLEAGITDLVTSVEDT